MEVSHAVALLIIFFAVTSLISFLIGSMVMDDLVNPFPVSIPLTVIVGVGLFIATAVEHEDEQTQSPKRVAEGVRMIVTAQREWWDESTTYVEVTDRTNCLRIRDTQTGQGDWGFIKVACEDAATGIPVR